MNDKTKIFKNLKSTLTIVTITNFLAFILFLIAFILTKNYWYLAVTGIVIVSLIAFYIYYGKIKKKFENILKPDDQINE